MFASPPPSRFLDRITPHPRKHRLDLLFKPHDQFAVRVNKRLFRLDLGDDGLLRGEGWERDSITFYN